MKKEYTIAVLKGDGIGPEIVEASLDVWKAIESKFDLTIHWKEALVGGAAYDAVGDPLPQETVTLCKESDAVLLGAVGGEKWDGIEPEKRPEKGLLKLRKSLGLYANLRPATIFPALRKSSPLREEILGEGVDLLVVRELLGGIYFGERNREIREGLRYAYDVESYDEKEIERIAKVAFERAMERRRKVTLVDKANVLDSSKLWREVVFELSKNYPEVRVESLYVDNAAMQLIRNPGQFDVILTNNIFGDILSDEASMITGSIGMLPSASLSESGIHLYEPIHGSAPDIAGKDRANPLATILSTAMMARISIEREDVAQAIEKAVEETLEAGLGTGDLLYDKRESLGCRAMGRAVAERIS